MPNRMAKKKKKDKVRNNTIVLFSKCNRLYMNNILNIPILKTGINKPDGTGNVAAKVVVIN